MSKKNRGKVDLQSEEGEPPPDLTAKLHRFRISSWSSTEGQERGSAEMEAFHAPSLVAITSWRII